MPDALALEPTVGDALGFAVLDYLEHGSEARRHFIERDDGLLEAFDTGIMFGQASQWSEIEAPIEQLAGRRVLDVGAGAGRHAVALQDSGRDVVALDVSEGAVEVCRRRGVREAFTGTIYDLAEANPEPFDTFLLCGNNFGLLESPENAPRFFEALRGLATPGAEIIGTCVDPFATEDPIHLDYHERNRSRGRHPGQLSLRVRWTNLATPWFDYLFLPIVELERLAASAGWKLVDYQPGSLPYLAIVQLGDHA